MMGNTNIFTLCSREQAINLRAVRHRHMDCGVAWRGVHSLSCLPCPGLPSSPLPPHSATASTWKSGLKLSIRCRPEAS